MAQNGQEAALGCGTTTGAEEYLLDTFYGSNQKIVDVLLENNVNIISVSSLPNGIYYVRLEGATGVFTKKLILKK